jgi:YD repeat-containing protein
VTDALNQATSYSYDAMGNLTRVTDANGHQTTYTYDALGRPLTVADGLSNATSYTWYPYSNLTQVRDALTVTNRAVYDKANRLTAIDLSNNLTTDIGYAYDAASRRTSISAPPSATPSAIPARRLALPIPPRRRYPVPLATAATNARCWWHGGGRRMQRELGQPRRRSAGVSGSGRPCSPLCATATSASTGSARSSPIPATGWIRSPSAG